MLKGQISGMATHLKKGSNRLICIQSNGSFQAALCFMFNFANMFEMNKGSFLRPKTVAQKHFQKQHFLNISTELHRKKIVAESLSLLTQVFFAKFFRADIL